MTHLCKKAENSFQNNNRIEDSLQSDDIIEDSLQSVLRSFYKKLKYIEKIFLYMFLIDMIGYTILFITYLISTGTFYSNYIAIPLIFFPIISGITMFYSKTIPHGIAFIIVHTFPVIMGGSLFRTQSNSCAELPAKSCYFPKDNIFYTSGSLLLAFLVMFTVFYCVMLHYLWRKRVWPMRHKYPHSEAKEIISMDSVYQLQFPIFHAKIMMLGLWVIFYTIVIWGFGILGYNIRRIGIISFIVPLDIFTLFYTFFMLKGVRDESILLMFVVYIGNILQAMLLYFGTIDFCYIRYNRRKTLQYCLRYDHFFNTFLIMSIISWIILILSTLNSLRCQKNFGKYIGFYLRYEPTPKEFKSEKKFIKRESLSLTDLDVLII
ncbi:uncharacterized protein OCT59_013681 [Rhizophagus irregularis]|uniref:Uncharacterized protein n=1 Tax=Rhizophagus irregularis (strain DAOM 181602 / DAOM 197198 / MUCL 43194) TaxID=747089 RepID=A0A2P4QJH1_RHIID|nr:hypothetical protein GLOIN_2v1543724 [Rhizophagus irregularis DAOM 181602=DAOM 197198]POG77784.1 hypothetical protein GLOIN_2v1543724 [Rhizophagus irregularis DAOM 181602=DAOM 197198]UZO21284.1 hypothetical protein OCT59_013681 [Rhizophagus irregularis]GBC45816.2 hypothetical protein GLOIN_2v1543724 [Rhizophagus irregularis DAOM 181602=DAOM 197198]|eukprot:XP_025184650.1 hypothetical protein GLOIN_2v1543724 [Rhizophagus irregularis DAOM 181602=DAOM 197198]